MPPVRESLAVSGSSGQIPAGATVGGRFRIDGLLSQDGVSQTPVFVSSASDVETVKVQVPMTGPRLFLRVRITPL